MKKWALATLCVAAGVTAGYLAGRNERVVNGVNNLRNRAGRALTGGGSVESPRDFNRNNNNSNRG